METRIREQVKEMLQTAGWLSDDILEEQTFEFEGNIYRPDIILTNDLNPIAILEVKASKVEIDLNEAWFQLEGYFDGLTMSIGFVTNGEEIYQYSTLNRQFEKIEKYPAPEELSKIVFGDKYRHTPFGIVPARISKVSPTLHQIEAVYKVIVSLQSGKKRLHVQMVTGSGKTYTALQICWKLIKSRFVKRILFISDTKMLREQAKSMFSHLDLRSSSDVNNKNDELCITSLRQVLESQILKNIDRETMVLIDDSHLSVEDLIEFSPNSIIIYFSSIELDWSLLKIFGPPVFSYSYSQALVNNNLKPPTGFETRPLDEIAEVRSGLPVDIIREDNTGQLQHIRVVKGKDLETENIDFDRLMIVPKFLLQKDLDERFSLKHNDILISTLPMKGEYKVTILSGKVPLFTTFATSIIRIRVHSDSANPKDVFSYLTSETGQSIIRLSATRGATSSPRILPRGLSQLPIFLPMGEKSKKEINELGALSLAKLRLSEQIVPKLIELEKQSNNPSELILLAEQLRQIAGMIAPMPIAENVQRSFPIPIALAFRKYIDSRFNVYEQVLRLRDIFEATCFYVYNICLADAIHRLDPKVFFIGDKGARRAYNGYSMSSRLDFVGDLIDLAIKNNHDDLFLSELTKTSFVAQAKDFQENYRNKLSHSATATESQQHKVLEEFEPIVLKMLSELEFLAKYRLVRIPSFYFKEGRTVRRLEVYHGVVPEVEEQTLQSTNELIMADRDHIILLNEENEPLCLHPLYQLLSSSETRNETHLCFLKQRKKALSSLEGESVQGAFEVQLIGYQEFDALQNKILETL